MWHVWGEEGFYRILVGKPKGKRPIGRFIRRWKDNIKMNLKSISWETVEWIDLAHDRYN